MRYLLDTGLLIRHLRGEKSTVQLVRSLGKANRLCISSMTRLEVRAGMYMDEQAATDKLLSRFTNLDLDAAVADKAGEVVFRSRRANKLIAMPDAVIAATALVHNITLVTFNISDFRDIVNLSLHPLSS